MPERLSVAGFLRGRRYVAEHATPEYFNLYEVETVDVLTGKEYLGRLNNPTPWTRRALAHFRNVSRSLCRIGASIGTAQGGLITTWRFEVAAGWEERCRRFLAEAALPAIVKQPCIDAAHFGVADRPSSNLKTEERIHRGDITQVPGWVVLVEGLSRGALERAAGAALDTEALRAHGADGPIEEGVYRLECSLVGVGAVG
jgi:hypothetical protein